MEHRIVIVDGYNKTRARAAARRSPWRVVPVYVLTIVFLVSHVSITSMHASKDACEQAAERARLTNVGPQAVESARCEPQVPVAAAK